MNKNSTRGARINQSARTSGQDKGCELAPSCLDCPFPACVEEEMGGGKRWLKSLRDRQIVRLRRTTNISIAELGRRFRVSKRTVYRALQREANAVQSQVRLVRHGLSQSGADSDYIGGSGVQSLIEPDSGPPKFLKERLQIV